MAELLARKHGFHQNFKVSLLPTSKLSELTASVGDRVMLRWVQAKTTRLKLTQPLRENGETNVDNHKVQHKDIIGQPSNTKLLQVSKDGSRRVIVSARHPTLDEYTTLTPRRVAPIYSTYASTIVSMLDIHVDPPSNKNDPTKDSELSLQILEAGTGHGSLTLHLARAIATANPNIPLELKPKPSPNTVYKAGAEVDSFTEPPPSELAEWKRQRQAVVHTVDIDGGNSLHAEKLIRSYRNGLYWPHIDFHTGNVKDWVDAKMAEDSARPFLDVVILDMPGVEDQFAPTVAAIKEGGLLLAFAPQITQIAACVQEIVMKELGLKLEKVIELGDGISTGRYWDVRMAKLKNSKAGDNAVHRDIEASTNVKDAGESAGKIPPMVCRPIVGELTRGGGFVALWKRIS